MFGLSNPHPKDKGAKLAQQQNQAPDSIPGMFKPGEFVLPPDTVHAMGGKQALQSVVDATHTPVQPSFGLKAPRAAQAKAAPQMEFKPEVFFDNGGAPEDQLAKRAPVSPSNTFPQASPSAGANIYAGAGLSRDQLGSSGKLAQVPAGIGGNPAAPARPASQPAAPKPNSFGDAAAATSNAGVTQVSAPAMAATAPAAPPKPVQVGMTDAQRADALSQIPTDGPKAPAADGSQGAWRNTEVGRNISNSLAALPGMGGAGRVASTGGVISKGINAVSTAANNAGRIANTVPVVGPSLYGASEPAAAAAQNPNAAAITPWDHAKLAGALGGLDKEMAAQSRVDSVLNKPTSASTGAGETVANNGLPTGVYNHGRGQYSDQAEGMGLPAGFTGRPNAQNMAAAANLSASNAAPAAGQAQEGGFGLNVPTVAHSGNDWAARQRLKNMETSASSIMNTQRWGGKNALQNPAVQNFIDAQRADLAAQGKIPDLQLKTNEINAGLQRTAMAEAGADRRSQGQLALGMQRNLLDAQRINSDERLRAPQIRAAERLEKLQEAFINAKTTQEKAEIAAQIRAYNGKMEEDRWKAVALQGGTDAQGNKTESLLGAVNERTGEMKRMDGGQKAAPLPNHVEYLKKNPQYAEQFDQIYGQGAAQRAIKS